MTASRQIVNALREHHDELAADPGKLYALVDSIAVPHFDVETVSRLVLGPHWRRATPDQRRKFVNAFKRLIVNSYAKALLLHSNEEIQVQPVPESELASRHVSVHSTVSPGSGQAVSIMYRMRMKNGAWKIYDFDVEGVSLILNYKHSFAEQIDREGLDGLIRSIDEKNARFKL